MGILIGVYNSLFNWPNKHILGCICTCVFIRLNNSLYHHRRAQPIALGCAPQSSNIFACVCMCIYSILMVSAEQWTVSEVFIFIIFYYFRSHIRDFGEISGVYFCAARLTQYISVHYCTLNAVYFCALLHV